MAIRLTPDLRWVEDVTLAEHFHWTYDEIEEAPDWWVERALMLISVKTEIANRRAKAG